MTCKPSEGSVILVAEYEKTEATSESEGEPISTDDAQILKDSRDGLKICIDDEQELRGLMLDDLKFASLDQWPADIRSSRENDTVNGPRPCLTIDQINQYITQVSNDMAANKPSVKVRPENDEADIETAKIFDGRIRHIEDRSNAKIAYHTAGDSAVTIGLGYFRVLADYVSPDSFDQELLVKRIPDTFSVYLSAHIMPDGSDAEKGWVMQEVPIETFKRDYPGKKIAEADFAGLGVTPSWKKDDSVMICEYFYKQYTKVNLLFLEDGRTMTREEYNKSSGFFKRMLGRIPAITGERDSQKVTVKWCKHSGCEVLDKRDLKGMYIPIVEVVGKEKIVEGKRLLWGLVRPAKDSLRAFNYWISAMTEKMALAPKAPFVGAVGQFATQGDKWDKVNVNNYAKLEYDPIDVNGNAIAPPRRQEPMQMEPAMAQMLQIMQNNVKSSLGMYKASVGDTQGGDQSGRAILALKKESDTGTMHFGANQALAIEHCGRILVDLIPYYTDTKQIIQILGEDGKPQSVAIDPDQDVAMREVRDGTGKVRRIFNLNKGKYGVTVTVGPGYTTSRQEAAAVMTELANSAKDPISAAIMRYGAVKNADFHGSEEIMRMLKAMLPPQLQSDDGQEIPPEAMAKIGQLTQQMQMMNEKGQELVQENQQLKSGAEASKAKVAADHDAKMEQVALDAKVAGEKALLAREQFEFDKKLEIDKANHAIDLAEREAFAANKQQTDKLSFERECKIKEEQENAAMKNEKEASAIAPKLVEEMEQLKLTFTDALAQIVSSIKQPQTVTLSNVKFSKNKDGELVGGEATRTIN